MVTTRGPVFATMFIGVAAATLCACSREPRDDARAVASSTPPPPPPPAAVPAPPTAPSNPAAMFVAGARWTIPCFEERRVSRGAGLASAIEASEPAGDVTCTSDSPKRFDATVTARVTCRKGETRTVRWYALAHDTLYLLAGSPTPSNVARLAHRKSLFSKPPVEGMRVIEPAQWEGPNEFEFSNHTGDLWCIGQCNSSGDWAEADCYSEQRGWVGSYHGRDYGGLGFRGERCGEAIL
jgi:hypothetical protein